MSENTNIKVPFFCPSIGKEEQEAVLEVMKSGWLTTGKITEKFEKEFSAFIGSKHALAVNSNTSGMILAMEACGVKKGKAIITTPYTFVSTATTAIHLGADVFFADTEKETYSIDPEKIEDLLKKDTEHKICAIVPVHVAGNLCNMKKINELAEKYSTNENKIYVIEDAAHSFPSKTENGYSGTLGDIGVFSFYATKTITTGEGGMITTNNDTFAKRMNIMRLHGMDRTTWDRYTNPKASWEYDIVDSGYKFNLPDILSAIGREQLKKAEDFRIKRTHIAEKYNKEFSKYDFLQIPPTSEGNSWHLYLIQLKKDKLNCTRTEFAKELQENGLGISMHFIPLFHFSYWKNKYKDFIPSKYPNANNHYENTITLPFWPEMTKEMIDKVINTVIQIGKKHYVC